MLFRSSQTTRPSDFVLVATTEIYTLSLHDALPISQGELSQSGNLRISFSGDFSPHSLPRDRHAPISVHVKGAIETTDGSHPPPARRVEIALNRNGKLTTRLLLEKLRADERGYDLARVGLGEGRRSEEHTSELQSQ